MKWWVCLSLLFCDQRSPSPKPNFLLLSPRSSSSSFLWVTVSHCLYRRFQTGLHETTRWRVWRKTALNGQCLCYSSSRCLGYTLRSRGQRKFRSILRRKICFRFRSGWKKSTCSERGIEGREMDFHWARGEGKSDRLFAIEPFWGSERGRHECRSQI